MADDVNVDFWDEYVARLNCTTTGPDKLRWLRALWLMDLSTIMTLIQHSPLRLPNYLYLFDLQSFHASQHHLYLASRIMGFHASRIAL